MSLKGGKYSHINTHWWADFSPLTPLAWWERYVTGKSCAMS